VTKLYTSGDRTSWLRAVARTIMDGGSHPPSVDRLNLVVPPTIVTKENDGHVTAAAKFGEKSRDDFKAGWRVIIDEMLGLLREQGFVNGEDSALRWIKPLDGIWQVAMPDHGGDVTIFGQTERRLSRDRAMLGERDEQDGSPIGPQGTIASDGRGHPIEVIVIGPRGGETKEKFQAHPIALAIPRMTERERETLRDSIARDGVKVPLVIYQKKVLDGINRLYFAGQLNKPVRVEEFIGTEEEARRHVAILNLHRRHLGPSQRTQAAIALFGEVARKETAAALEKGRSYGQAGKPNSAPKTAQSSQPKRAPQWHEIVANEANKVGLKVTPSAVRAMKEVQDAPITKAKVEAGEIYSVKAAHDAAIAEKGMPTETQIQAVSPLSVNRRLGACIEHLKSILVDTRMPEGQGLPMHITERLDQIEKMVPLVRQALRQRGVIS
jgi:hypothetical protein